MSIVQCDICEREETVDFGWCLGHGWPKCHERTMRLTDAGDYESSIEDYFRPLGEKITKIVAGR